MATVRTTRGRGFDSAPFQRILYWVVVTIVCAFGLPLLWKYIRNFLQSEQDNQADNVAENPIRLKDAMDIAWENFKDYISASDRDNIQSAAKIIYEAFNIPKHWYSWFNPANWFEDDDKAFNALMASSGALADTPQHEYLSVCYMLVSGSDRRDLTRDIIKYLNEDKYKPFLTGLS